MSMTNKIDDFTKVETTCQQCDSVYNLELVNYARKCNMQTCLCIKQFIEKAFPRNKQC